jgi:hypothetical protein
LSVTDLPASSEDQTGKHDPSTAPGAASDTKGRLGRRFILTGMPFAMTLANRPAFATGGLCTMSVLASANLSNPIEQNMNCGVSPGCWAQKALRDDAWQSSMPIGLSPDSSFRAVFSMPSNWRLSAPNDSQCNPIEATLYQVLTQPLKLVYVPSSGPKIKGSDGGAAMHIVAGYLNALAFNSGHVVNGVVIWGHYPVTDTGVMNTVLGLWSPAPTAADIDSRIAAVKNYAYVVVDNQHYCDVGL